MLEMTGRGGQDDGDGRTVVGNFSVSIRKPHLDLRHKCLYREISMFSSVMEGKMLMSHS